MRPPTIFVINPGSTSTKIALYRGRRCAWDIEVKHVQAEDWPTAPPSSRRTRCGARRIEQGACPARDRPGGHRPVHRARRLAPPGARRRVRSERRHAGGPAKLQVRPARLQSRGDPGGGDGPGRRQEGLHRKPGGCGRAGRRGAADGPPRDSAAKHFSRPQPEGRGPQGGGQAGQALSEVQPDRRAYGRRDYDRATARGGSSM